MRQILSIFVLFAFVFSASGLSKYIQTQAPQSSTQAIVSNLDVQPIQTNVDKCCSHDDEQSENNQPRCIGDICIEPVSITATTLGFGDKLPLLTYSYVSTSVSTSFLRPPIA